MTRLARLAAATLVGVAAVAAAPAGPASAAACPQGTGVSVVVDGSVRCDANGAGKTASANFEGVGHDLTYVTTQPGFVCQVDSAPSSADCRRTPPSSAYWALWWSDGTSGSWVYSSRGATSLKVPAGGFVAFVFGNGKTPPGVNPVAASAPATSRPATPKTPKPTAKATAKPSSKPSSTATARPSATAATPTPSATAPTPTASATPTEADQSAVPEPTATPAEAESSTEPTTDETRAASDESSGSAGTLWAGVAIAVALLAGMGGIVWRRRAEGGRDS